MLRSWPDRAAGGGPSDTTLREGVLFLVALAVYRLAGYLAAREAKDLPVQSGVIAGLFTVLIPLFIGLAWALLLPRQSVQSVAQQGS